MDAGADQITWQSLTTAGGASVGAILIVAFAKVLVTDLSAYRARILAALTGLILVEVAVLALNGFALLTLGLGIFVGIQAGLAATKAVEVYSNGVDHIVLPNDQVPPRPKT